MEEVLVGNLSSSVYLGTVPRGTWVRLNGGRQVPLVSQGLAIGVEMDGWDQASHSEQLHPGPPSALSRSGEQRQVFCSMPRDWAGLLLQRKSGWAG
jgi:hypothetical protein